ncbi:MAG: hypothetical protein KAQ70_01895, partial [Candidatus Heimdallarchaeota archaeon]|nr:hypothetical protein [Candidatus Heimdallarchaeota archaeon]
KDIAKIRSKYDALMAVAGGLETDDVRRAYFNGADIAILNVIGANDPNKGLHENENFRQLIPAILAEVWPLEFFSPISIFLTIKHDFFSHSKTMSFLLTKFFSLIFLLMSSTC